MGKINWFQSGATIREKSPTASSCALGAQTQATAKLNPWDLGVHEEGGCCSTRERSASNSKLTAASAHARNPGAIPRCAKKPPNEASWWRSGASRRICSFTQQTRASASRKVDPRAPSRVFHAELELELMGLKEENSGAASWVRNPVRANSPHTDRAES